MAELNEKIGFIGGGNMAEAILGALIRSGISKPSRLQASDVSAERRQYLEKTYGITATDKNEAVFLACDVILLAVKPQVIDAVLTELGDILAEKKPTASRKLIISIAAGIPIKRIEERLYDRLDTTAATDLPIVRVMPNTPALVMAGMSGISVNRNATSDDKDIAMAILAATGMVLEFNEEALNAVTAVSGSGPAYVFYLVEAMIEAGVNLGLSGAEATTLTLQTLKGAVKLLEESRESARELRRRVTSPGGTTEAALKVMDNGKVKEQIIAALAAACSRAHELSG
jgi:pyrroline-5-carboxylate reductase